MLLWFEVHSRSFFGGWYGEGGRWVKNCSWRCEIITCERQAWDAFLTCVKSECFQKHKLAKSASTSVKDSDYFMPSQYQIWKLLKNRNSGESSFERDWGVGGERQDHFRGCMKWNLQLLNFCCCLVSSQTWWWYYHIMYIIYTEIASRSRHRRQMRTIVPYVNSRKSFSPWTTE